MQWEHIWTMDYKSHITQAKTHPPSLESHVITIMEPHFTESSFHRGRQACPRCTRVAYNNSIGFLMPTRRSRQMICIEQDAGSCIDQASPYESLPAICPCRALDLPSTQITRCEKVSPMEIINGDFAGESRIVVAMSRKVHGGAPRAIHKNNACVGQIREVSSHKIIYTSHQRLHFGGPCGNCNLLAKAWKCLNGPKEKPPIVGAMSLNGLETPCMT